MVGQTIVSFIDHKLSQIMQSVSMSGQGSMGQVEPRALGWAVKILKFLSGAFQLMPIELCAELVPQVLNFSAIEDPTIKLNSYLALEVLFASRRFTTADLSSSGQQSIGLTATKTLKYMLDNGEALMLTMADELEDEAGDNNRTKASVNRKDEMKVVSYIQALTQVILNIATVQDESQYDYDTILRLVATTISSLTDNLLGTTWKVQKATSSAIKLIITHGLTKIRARPPAGYDAQPGNGAERLFANMTYLLSTRFLEGAGAVEACFDIVRCFIEKAPVNLASPAR